MKRMIIVFISLFVLLSGCTIFPATSENKPSQKEIISWQEDIDYLVEQLEENHPNPYHSVSKKSFHKDVEELKKDLPTLTEIEAKLKIIQLIATLKEAHTGAYLDDSEQSIYPVSFKNFMGEIYAVAADPAYQEIIGMQLTSINGVPLSKVLKQIDTLISYETQNWADDFEQSFLPNATYLEFLHITSKEKSDWTFIDEDHQEVTVSIKADKKKNIDKTKYVSFPRKETPVSEKVDNIYEGLYWVRYIPSENVLYIRYNSCEDYKIMEFKDDIISAFRTNQPSKVIFDLRYNSGGSSHYLDMIISHIKELTTMQTTSKNIVLINNGTFSSGVSGAYNLHTELNAMLIGRETGGMMNGYGDIIIDHLPNSNMIFAYSIKYFELDKNYKYGLTPDISCQQTYEDYINGIDTCYERALEVRK